MLQLLSEESVKLWHVTYDFLMTFIWFRLFKWMVSRLQWSRYTGGSLAGPVGRPVRFFATRSFLARRVLTRVFDTAPYTYPMYSDLYVYITHTVDKWRCVLHDFSILHLIPTRCRLVCTGISKDVLHDFSILHHIPTLPSISKDMCYTIFRYCTTIQ